MMSCAKMCPNQASFTGWFYAAVTNIAGLFDQIDKIFSLVIVIVNNIIAITI